MELMRKGFEHEDIAVLSFRGTGNSVFSSEKKVGSHALRNFSGEYDMFGNQVFTPGKLLFETIGRFKGQQVPAVILTDVDPKLGDDERTLRLLFCGMTRATVRLDIFVRGGSPFTELLAR
jgi:superfamily I DNA and RNA helicase